jgi:hypothetical protein
LALRGVFEAPGLVASFDDLAVMGEPVEQRGGHLGVAEDGWPFAEGGLAPSGLSSYDRNLDGPPRLLPFPWTSY